MKVKMNIALRIRTLSPVRLVLADSSNRIFMLLVFVLALCCLLLFDAGSQKALQKKYGNFLEIWTAIYRPYSCYQR
jgi:hypothetical protein